MQNAVRAFTQARQAARRHDRAVDYVRVQRMNDRRDPRNEGSYLKSGFIDGFPAELAGTLIEGFEPDPERDTVFFFQHAGGAIGRVRADATAFPHRRATHNMFSTVTWPSTPMLPRTSNT